MKSCMKLLPLIAVLSLVFLVGCSKDNGTGPTTPVDPQGWINLAWSQYEAGDYGGAGNSFDSGYLLAVSDSLAAYLDSTNAAHANPPDSVGIQAAVAQLKTARGQIFQIASGGGWVSLRLGMPGQANNNFIAALGLYAPYIDSLGLTYVHIEILGGYAFTLQALANWVQSNERATSTLALSPTWSFTHDTQFNYLDLRLVRVENNFNMGQFQASLDEALALNAIVDPSSPLGPDDFNLATMAGYTKLQQLIYTLDDLI